MPKLLEIAADQTAEIVRLRRDFHRHPELSFREERTSRVIRGYLEDLGFRVHQPSGMHGLWADLDVAGAGKRLLFRADMDALAMTEMTHPTKQDFLSVEEGVAHCCGHDSHMAMLLAAARVLAAGHIKASHSVRFLFQHAEEKAPGGAIDLIREGCLEDVDEAYGLHVMPSLGSGRFAVAAGAFMAAADELRLVVRGKGVHAAMPHLGRDPIVAAAQVVTALQQLVSRRAGPLESLVVTIASIRGGSGTTNVIPDEVELLGTVRTLDRELWAQAPTWIGETASAAARACGCTAELAYGRGYPVLVNDIGAASTAGQCVRELFGEEGLVPHPEPWMAAEDFARYAEARPSCYVFLGVGSEEKGITSPNHATDFDVDEAALHRGTAWFLRLAVG